MAIQKSSSIIFFFLLLLWSPLLLEKLSFDYIFQFGDSLNDTGNFQWDDGNPMCKRFPYGISLGGPPSRCSNGLLIIDYFAKFFNLSPNPYLKEGADFSEAVNFAVAGSTAIDASILRQKYGFSPNTNKSLSVQLHWFKSHLNSMCNGALECRQVLEKSLIILGEIGGNDYNHAIWENKSTNRELNELVHQVIQVIKDAAKEFINLGARTMVLAGNLPIGCFPTYLYIFKANDQNIYDDLNCLKNWNDFATIHNDRIQDVIKELRQEFPHVAIVYADYFSAYRWVIKMAPSFGFDKDDIQKACCGIGDDEFNFNLTRLCGSQGVPVCADPNKRISWDGLHLTQHAYQLMAQWLIRRMVPDILVSSHVQIL